MSSGENTSIHEFDLELIGEFFAGADRQGPGSPEVTLQALSFIDNLTDDSRIVDLGCGTGGQTLVLAHNAPGTIEAMDIFQRKIDILNANAEKHNLQNRLKGIVGSMDDLPYEKDSLDLVWSEGAIYNIGFESGLKLWHTYLKQGGYVAVTEASWFTEERPREIEDFWNMEYPDINTIPNQIEQLQRSGYKLVAAFVLPEVCWTTNFFDGLVPLEEPFLARHPGNEFARTFIARMRHERELYNKYKAYYGYTFFIGKKW